MKTEQIGTKLVQYDPNDPEGTVRVLFDGGSSSGKVVKPPIVTLSSEEKQSLILAGFTAQEIDNIESDVSESTLPVVLEGIENEEQKKAVKAVYSGKKSSFEDQINEAFGTDNTIEDTPPEEYKPTFLQKLSQLFD